MLAEIEVAEKEAKVVSGYHRLFNQPGLLRQENAMSDVRMVAGLGLSVIGR